jgi:NADP-dependent 3-hydroxy acid dehydrogenase YdfG
MIPMRARFRSATDGMRWPDTLLADLNVRLRHRQCGRAIVFAYQQPAHVTVTELALRPLNQPE